MLANGTHSTPDDGRCAMEWVSHLAGEPHSDEPRCVSPVLRIFCATLNDALDDDRRQGLRPYLTRTIGTADDGLDEARSWLALDWLIRTYAPTWLRVAQLPTAARRLSELPPVLSGSDLRPALDALTTARRESRATWTASVGPVRAVTRMPRRAAAREWAWNSSGAAAWAAARLRVGEIAADRARAVVRDIGGDGAATLARASFGPIVEQLNRSAFALLDRMLPTETVRLDQGDSSRRSAALVCAASSTSSYMR
jgi:hypothetical protein